MAFRVRIRVPKARADQPARQPANPSQRPWRAMLALLALLLVTLCLCVIVTGIRGSGSKIADAGVRWLAKLPLVGRLVQPALDKAPPAEEPALNMAAAPQATASPVPASPQHYLVRPTNWPDKWPWPPASHADAAPQQAVAPLAVEATPQPALLVKPANWPADKPWPPEP